MPLVFDRFWNTLKEKGHNTSWIRKENIISQSALTSIKNNRHVSTETVEKLCRALECQPEDLMEYIPDEKPKE